MIKRRFVVNSNHQENEKDTILSSGYSDYPRMTAFKSKWNIIRQKMLGFATHTLQAFAQNKIDNPYLKGIYAPVDEVEMTHFNVTGEIPKSFNGILLRMGPNPIRVDRPSLYHWFSGDGMIHGLRIQSGEINWFRSRYIATDKIQKRKVQPNKSGFRRGPGDVVNTNAFQHAGKIWAMIEAGTYPACLDYELNTETHRLLNTDADLPFTAHPHQDPISGDLHAICYDALDTHHAYYEVFDELGHLTHFCKIPVEHGPMIHDSAITQTDVLIFDFPVTFIQSEILKGNPLPYAWNPKHQARVGILPKFGDAQDVIWVHVDPCFIFHAANAYRDENQKIILDVVVHDRMFDHSKQGPFEQQKTQLERWIIDSDQKHIERILLDAQTQEFPRIDERFTGEKYRYIYSASYDSKQMTKANQLLCHDLISGERVAYDFGSDWMTGEAVFIPESASAEEGVGYLMSYVHHVESKDSKVVILKVNGLNIQLQAEIELGVRVPIGFHSNWVDLS